MTMLSVREAAKLLRVSPRYIRALIASEQLKAKKIGWSWVIDEKAVEAFKRRKSKRFRGAVIINEPAERSDSKHKKRKKVAGVKPIYIRSKVHDNNAVHVCSTEELFELLGME